MWSINIVNILSGVSIIFLSLAEGKYWCLVCFQTPVIALVGNDACWSQIAREQVPMFGSSIGCDLEVRNSLVHQAKAEIAIKPMHQGQKGSKEKNQSSMAFWVTWLLMV